MIYMNRGYGRDKGEYNNDGSKEGRGGEYRINDIYM
jgi:hypothetical protein